MTPLDLDRLAAEAFVRHLHYQPVLGSTNDHARSLAEDSKVPLPALVVADEQTAGRGRGTNRWWTGKGSLAFSLLLDTSAWQIPRSESPLVSLAAAAAIVEVLSPHVHDPIGLHWPNDVFVGERKICGILAEGLADGRLVLGVGLNVNNTTADAPAEVQQVAVTLRDLTGEVHNRTEVLLAVLSAFEAAARQLGTAPGRLAEHCNALCLQHGLELTIDTGYGRSTGTCAGIGVDGALLLETSTGRQKFYGGVLVK